MEVWRGPWEGVSWWEGEREGGWKGGRVGGCGRWLVGWIGGMEGGTDGQMGEERRREGEGKEEEEG